MKMPILLFAAMLCRSSFSQTIHPETFIDPTGTYILKGTIQKNKIMGHSGEIRVKLLDPARAAVSFYINKGYPGYESGAFVDTLSYHDNLIQYTPESDKDCTLIFIFSEKNAEVTQTYSDPDCHCSFGKDVMVSGTFQKYSSAMPVIQDMSAHGSGT